MGESVNHQLMPVNRRLIAVGATLCDIQPMVESTTDISRRLSLLRKRLALSYAKFGDLAGKKGQAAFKWCNGGGIEDDNLRALVDGVNDQFPQVGANFFELKYGRQREDIEVETVEDLDRATALDIFDNLPPEHRETWISIGHLMVQRYAAKGKANPFIQAEGKRMKREKA